MKKIICALVAAVLAAALCSCSSSSSSDTLPEIAAGKKADFEVSTPPRKAPAKLPNASEATPSLPAADAEKTQTGLPRKSCFLCLFCYLLK